MQRPVTEQQRHECRQAFVSSRVDLIKVATGQKLARKCATHLVLRLAGARLALEHLHVAQQPGVLRLKSDAAVACLRQLRVLLLKLLPQRRLHGVRVVQLRELEAQ